MTVLFKSPAERKHYIWREIIILSKKENISKKAAEKRIKKDYQFRLSLSPINIPSSQSDHMSLEEVVNEYCRIEEKDRHQSDSPDKRIEEEKETEQFKETFIYLSESTTQNKNICKVGKTTRDPEKRAKEYAGGAFKIYKYWSVPEISLSIYETRAHKSLKSYQVPSNEIGFREIFSINAKKALPIVEKSIEETNKELIKQEASNEIYQVEKNRQLEEKKQERIRREQQQLEKQRRIEKNKKEAELQAIKNRKAARENKDELINFLFGLVLLIAAIAFLNWFFEVAF